MTYKARHSNAKTTAWDMYGANKRRLHRDSAAPEPADDELPIIRLSPAVRESDRGADFYQRVPCRELGTADVRTDAERAHLDARKQQCLEKYRQFAPRSFQR